MTPIPGSGGTRVAHLAFIRVTFPVFGERPGRSLLNFFDWGDQNRPPVNQFIRPGDRIFVQCKGGPCLSRLEHFPPRLEIEERGGMYVLIDEGEPQDWEYLFVPNTY